MKTQVTGRHVEVTPGIRQVIDQKLSKLGRVLHDNAVSVQCVLGMDHHRCQAEIVLHVRGDHMLHGEGEGSQWSQAIGEAVEKVTQQALTLKGKWNNHRPDTRSS